MARTPSGPKRKDIPADVPPEEVPSGLTHAYFAALGYFVHNFAMTEVTLNDLAIGCILDGEGIAGNGKGGIKSAIGGMRFQTAADTLRRLAEAYGFAENERADINQALNQLGHIRYLRDRLQHNAAAPMKYPNGGWVFGTTNRISSRSENDTEVIFFTISNLYDAGHDATTAMTILIDILDKGNRIRGKFLSNLPPGPQPQPQSSAQEPWRYKPSELRREKASHLRSAREREAQPPPSGE